MSDEEQPSRGFTVVDKRTAQDADDAPRPAQPASEAPRVDAPAPAGVAPPPRESPPPASAEDAPHPPVDFSSLAVSLASSALYQLGLLPHPETKQPAEKNLPLARQNIDTLALLQEKTQGNLSEQEAKLLGDLLAEVRMRFVEASRD